MPIYLGDTEITALYLGDTEVTAAYLGDVLVYTSAPTYTGLVAQRAGGSDKYLVYATTLAQLNDTGSPDYQYSGVSGSVEVHVDELDSDGTTFVAGDPLPTGVFGWDAQQEVGITAVGLPSLQRDSGWSSSETSASDYCEYSLGIAGSFTVAIRFWTGPALTGFSNLIRAWAGGTQSTGHGMYRSGSNLLFQVRATTSLVRAQILLAVAVDTEYVAIGTYNGGSITLRLYEVGGGAPATGSDSGTPANQQANPYNLGGTVGGTPAADGDITYVRYYTGVLSTGAQDDIADDTDPTGGGTLYHDFVGLRSGVHLASEGPTGTTLIIPASTGGDLTAELVA